MTTLNEIQESISTPIERDLSDKSDLALQSLTISGLAEEAGEVVGLFKRELRNLPKDQLQCTREH